MKIILIFLLATAVGLWQLNENPRTFTITPVEDAVPVAPLPPEKPATSTTPKPTPGASTPRPTPVPTPTPTPGTVPTPAPEEEVPASQSYAEQIEELVLQKSNIERAKNDLGSLTMSARLSNIARAHSADMRSKNYFAHEDPNGCDSSCRADAAGYEWSMVGENIYMMSGFDLSAEAAAEKIVQGWMNSPGHRANILRSGYTETGIGVIAIGEDIYATAMYAKPR